MIRFLPALLLILATLAHGAAKAYVPEANPLAGTTVQYRSAAIDPVIVSVSSQDTAIDTQNGKILTRHAKVSIDQIPYAGGMPATLATKVRHPACHNDPLPHSGPIEPLMEPPSA